MLSYQHIYHAGNLADVQKHALLAWVLDYMTSKDKPLSYVETHAGRGLYALDAPEALKTGEAAAGIARMQARFAPDHPYRVALHAVQARHGKASYPGSPLIAATMLRPQDSLTLAELHPREFAALRANMAGHAATLRHEDGLDMALSVCPPTPRRGVLMIDPSYEVKGDYDRLPKLLGDIRRKWNVGVLMLWYPVLQAGLHGPMLAQIAQDQPDAAIFEIGFPPVRQGHRMVGSGMVVINPPWGMSDEAQRVKSLLAQV